MMESWGVDSGQLGSSEPSAISTPPTPRGRPAPSAISTPPPSRGRPAPSAGAACGSAPVAGSVAVVYQTSVRPGSPRRRGASSRSADSWRAEAPSPETPSRRGKRKLARKGMSPVASGKRRCPARPARRAVVYGSTVIEASGRRGVRDLQPSRSEGPPAVEGVPSPARGEGDAVADAPPGQWGDLRLTGGAGIVGPSGDAYPPGDARPCRAAKTRQPIGLGAQIETDRADAVLAVEPHPAHHGLPERRPEGRTASPVRCARAHARSSSMMRSVAVRYASAARCAAPWSPWSTASTTGASRAWAAAGSVKGPARAVRTGR